MNCYICSHEPSLGGTRFHIQEAIGICHNCGVAVCATHSSKSPEAGAPLLCPECARLLEPLKNTHPEKTLQPV